MSLKYQFFLILIWPIMASVLSFIIRANFFISTMIFLFIPAAFLSLVNGKFVKKIGLVTLLSVPLGIVTDYVMMSNGGWVVNTFVFPKLFGFVVIEDIIWYFLYIYLVLIYFETFLDHHKKVKFYKDRLEPFVVLMALITAVFSWAYFFRLDLLRIDYFYLKFGIIFVLLPIILALSNFPKLWAKFFKAGAFFFYLSSIYEFTALSLNQWNFPGKNQYINLVEIQGVKFPVEEFIFFLILSALAVLSFYEYFEDNPG